MALDVLTLGDDLVVPVLYESRDVLVLDNPVGSALQPALDRALASAPEWVRAHEIQLLRVAGNPETDATGIQLVVRTARAEEAYARQFERRPPMLDFLAVTGGKPNRRKWMTSLKVRPDPAVPERVLTDTTRGAHAETRFEALAHGDGMALLLARPLTLRPHQIRAHLAACGLPVLGDRLYGFGRERDKPGRTQRSERASTGIALRGVRIVFTCPFTARTLEVSAPADDFLAAYGFALEESEPEYDETNDAMEDSAPSAPPHSP